LGRPTPPTIGVVFAQRGTPFCSSFQDLKKDPFTEKRFVKTEASPKNSARISAFVGALFWPSSEICLIISISSPWLRTAQRLARQFDKT
jgi:hypothetical protein